MLNLSVNEQKQILGGKKEYICIIYDPSGKEYKSRRFKTLEDAEAWGYYTTRKGGSYKAGHVVD